MNEKLKHLDLFSGIGGFALGLESTGGFETVGFCDNEPFAQKVLKKHWPDVPCYEDVRDVGVDTVGYRGVDIITGGFPCQPYSVAGKQDPNDNRQLWPEMFRIIKEIRPTYVIGENVRNLISIREGVVFEQVCTDLEGEGYEVQTFVLPASAVNAPHQRYRCWIVAHANFKHDKQKHKSIFKTPQKKKQQIRRNGFNCSSKDVAYAKCNDRRNWSSTKPQKGNSWMEYRGSSKRQSFTKSNKNVANSCSTRRKVGIPKKGYRQEGNAEEPNNDSHRLSGWQGKDNWTAEPSVGRVAHGIPKRVDRLKGLGNAVVPQIPAVLGRAILEVHNG